MAKSYQFKCGCSIPIDPMLPSIHGHPSLIYPDDVTELPMECELTWGMLSEGHTKGVFQLESPLGRQWAKKLRPGVPNAAEGIEHLSALGALLRPACLKAKDEQGISMTEHYCRRKNGEEEVTFFHPALEAMLKSTYGVLCIDSETLIGTSTGEEVPISSLFRNTVVNCIDEVSLSSELRQCCGVAPTRFGRGIKVTLANGFSVVLTEDHEVITIDGRKQAKDLLVNEDAVACPVTIKSQEDNVHLAEWLGDDNDVAYLFGYFVGNGSWGKSGTMTLCTGTEDRADTIIRWMKTSLPLLVIRKYYATRAWHVAFHCPVLVNREGHGNRKRKLQRLFEEHSLNRSCLDKLIPLKIFRATKDIKLSFLSGLYDSDGGTHACNISSSSPSIIHGVRRLCSHLGLITNITPDNQHIHIVNTDRFYDIVGPKIKVRPLLFPRRTAETYGVFLKSDLHNILRKSGQSIRGYCQQNSLCRSVISRKSRFVEHGVGKRWGLEDSDVRFVPVTKLEIVENRQFYAMSVEQHHNLIANGIVVSNCFQEQAMAIAVKLAGFTPMEADDLRKAVGKKSTSLMAKVKTMFTEGAKKTGIVTAEEAVEIFGWIEKGQRYGFNRSHAVSYALIGYHTAHLKAHFPLQFYTSFLYYAKEKQDPLLEIRQLVNDAKTMGIEVMPPRFSDLKCNFSTDGVIITFGLADVKGVGSKQVMDMRENARLVEKSLEVPRVEWTWYDFLIYFADSCKSNVVRRMIEVGAMRNYGLDRQFMLAEYNAYSQLTEKEKKVICTLGETSRDCGGEGADCGNLADAIEALLDLPRGVANKNRREKVGTILKMLRNPPRPLIDTPEWIAKTEEECLGIPITCNRVDGTPNLKANTTCKEFRDGKDADCMILAVDIQEYRELRIQNGENRGKTMAFLTISDVSGSLEDVCMFSEAWGKYGNLINAGNTVELKGRRDPKRGSFIVEEAWKV